MAKTKHTKECIQAFIKDTLKKEVILIPVKEGMDSQVYEFKANNRKYIIRINKSDYGFMKDQFAYKMFSCENIPVPKIILCDKFGKESFYCISEKAEGITYEDSDHEIIVKLAPAVLALLLDISNQNISNTVGYGKIDYNTGNGEYKEYKGYLLSAINKSDWDTALDYCNELCIDMNPIINEFGRLLQYAPNDRKILHGDFANNNLIVNQKKNGFSGVIDWDYCGYGSPLETVAGANFWSEHLDCATELAKVYNEYYKDYPEYENVIKFFELRYAIEEIYDNIFECNDKVILWCYHRGLDIINGNVLVNGNKVFTKSTLM